MNLWQRLFRFEAARRPRPQMSVLTTETALDAQAALALLGQVPDPDEALRNAGIGRDKLRVLEYDDEIYAAMETRREAALATDWRIEPAPESGARGELAAMSIWEMLDPHMIGLLRSMWDAVPYGYSVVEVVYKREAERIGLANVSGKPFEWFEPNRDGGLIYKPQFGTATEVDTHFKFILTRRAATYRQPYGEALLSRLYWPWFLRGEGWKMWARHLERHGSPLLLGKIATDPPEHGESPAQQEERQRILNEAVQQLAAQLDAAARAASIATTADVTAIAAGNAGEAFNAFDAAIAKRIQKVVLGQTLTSDVGSSGSYAAAKVHDLVRQDRRMADLRLLTESVQKLVGALAALNGWPEPVFAFAGDVDLQDERATRDQKLVTAGIATLTNDYLMRVYDFEDGDLADKPAAPPRPAAAEQEAEPEGPEGEEPEQEEEGGEEPEDDTSFAAPGGAIDPLRFAAPRAGGARKFTPAQQAVENLADEALTRAKTPIAPNKIAAALRAAKDPEDLAGRLAAVYEGADAAEFRDILERALFAADLMGYVHNTEQDDLDGGR